VDRCGAKRLDGTYQRPATPTSTLHLKMSTLPPRPWAAPEETAAATRPSAGSPPASAQWSSSPVQWASPKKKWGQGPPCSWPPIRRGRPIAARVTAVGTEAARHRGILCSGRR
jgi:hypothetical protein